MLKWSLGLLYISSINHFLPPCLRSLIRLWRVLCVTPWNTRNRLCWMAYTTNFQRSLPLPPSLSDRLSATIQELPHSLMDKLLL